MPYTLYTDKNENFICEVSVKNASMKDAFARMVVESDNLTLLFKGELKDGKCIVPINRLKGLLDEGLKGKMHLEVVVEDTYFKPWQDNFVVEQHTAVKVQVQEQKKPSRPIVEVHTLPKILPKPSSPVSELIFICEKVGITKYNLHQRSKDFKQVIREYFRSSPEYIKKSASIIKETLSALK